MASNTSSTAVQDLFDTSHIHLPFAVRYLLEVCISHGLLSEYNITREFTSKLAGLEEVQARKLLEHVTLQNKTYYNPMEIFDIKFVKRATVRRYRLTVAWYVLRELPPARFTTACLL
jgi:RNA-dependent RNA polymerase